MRPNNLYRNIEDILTKYIPENCPDCGKEIVSIKEWDKMLDEIEKLIGEIKNDIDEAIGPLG